MGVACIDIGPEPLLVSGKALHLQLVEYEFDARDHGFDRGRRKAVRINAHEIPAIHVFEISMTTDPAHCRTGP